MMTIMTIRMMKTMTNSDCDDDDGGGKALCCIVMAVVADLSVT